ncbi:hypothetical protein KFE98_13905 [bacterium SCSIO 12741]|nr:hypothetical protein KFE98_13905 [bacterium SCSIO 12741]
MIWDESDERDWRITGTWKWTLKEDCLQVPNHHGVFLFADSKHRIKYIGLVQTENLGQELKGLFKKSQGYGSSRFKILFTSDEEQAYSLKLSLEGKYDPPNNQDLKTQRLRSSLRKYSSHSENWLAPLYFKTPIK